MAGNVALYAALRLAYWLVPLLPLRLAYGAACLVGDLAYFLLPRPRAGISANLSHVTGRPPADPLIQRYARLAFRNDAKNWVDTLRIGRLTREAILSCVDIDGWESLADAVAAGRGVILLTLHLGNFDLVGQVLAARGLEVTAPVERMRPERLFHLVLNERRSQGINAVAVEEAPRAMLRTLRDGKLVAIAADRLTAGRGVRVPFFGADATLPSGPVSLARRTGATVLLGVGIRTPLNRFAGYVTGPIPMTFTGDAEYDIRSNTRRLAGVMEPFIAEHPEQWLMFSALWGPDELADRAATIGNRNEAAV